MKIVVTALTLSVATAGGVAAQDETPTTGSFIAEMCLVTGRTGEVPLSVCLDQADRTYTFYQQLSSVYGAEPMNWLFEACHRVGGRSTVHTAVCAVSFIEDAIKVEEQYSDMMGDALPECFNVWGNSTNYENARYLIAEYRLRYQSKFEDYPFDYVRMCD